MAEELAVGGHEPAPDTAGRPNRCGRGHGAVYLPLRLFGPSPRLGLSPAEYRLIRAVVLELTRDSKKGTTGRPDRAQLIAGGVSTADPSGVAVYPGLAAGTRYVGFNGNGKG